jgi:CheY-like chemotaxis protein
VYENQQERPETSNARFVLVSKDTERPRGTEPKMESETILVVDDEPMVREYCHSVLARAGYHVLQAGSGEEALAICSEHKGTISLALVDVVMPGINGVKLGKLLNRRMRIAIWLYASGNQTAHWEKWRRLPFLLEAI